MLDKTVSILILLEVLLQRTPGGSRNTGLCVSILILLEVLLQRSPAKLFPILAIGFNPYFTGSSTSTEGRIGGQILINGFQSLFYWKFYFNAFTGLIFLL